MDQAARVRAVLERGVLPSVVARGGELRVLRVDDGVVTLEISGSPGAALPLLDRIEALVRSAVPGIVSVRVAGPAAAGPAGADLGERVRRVLDAEVNPAIAAHRGRVTVAGVDGGRVSIRLEGGCQGCSLAEVTVRQGVEPLLRARFPEVAGVTDATDHAAGRDPFFSPAKR